MTRPNGPIDPDDPDADLFDADPVEGDPVEVAITDVLDLHSFRPKEIVDVVDAYLDAALEEGLTELRIIHGRGIGMQRRNVQKLLVRDERVISFADAPPEAGGWGATLVELKTKENN